MLLKIVNDIERGIGDGKCTVLLALDISAAFDAIDHSILFRRAEDDFGLRDAALGWLRAFTVNRSQYVAVGNFAQRAFSISATTVWNSLSLDTRLADSVNIVKNRLKTELFALAYTV